VVKDPQALKYGSSQYHLNSQENNQCNNATTPSRPTHVQKNETVNGKRL